MAEKTKTRSSSIDRMATAYLSDSAYAIVRGASKSCNSSVSKVVSKAVRAWIDSLSEDEKKKYLLHSLAK